MGGSGGLPAPSEGVGFGDPLTGLLGAAGEASAMPEPPVYSAPPVAPIPMPNFLDRAAAGLASTPAYAPRPYESAGSAVASGLTAGLARGFGGGRLLKMQTEQANREAVAKANATAADRNYANQLETWKVRLKKYMDDQGNVKIGSDLIGLYPALAPFRNRALPVGDVIQYASRADASSLQRASLAETQRHNRVMESKPSGSASQPGMDNVSESIADAIESGLQPPDIRGLYRYGGPVRASLAARKYDLKSANLDWQATQRWVATANGTQQTRMRQAAATAYESLDVVDQLSAQLSRQIPRGSIKVFNRAALVAAQNGAFGPDAQSTATNLQAQITDIVSELGNVYMGGNSPTDHALSLASKNLSADWNEKQLRDAVELARTNLKIRLNSIQNVSPIVPGSPGAGIPAGPGGVPESSAPAPRKGGFWDALVRGGH